MKKPFRVLILDDSIYPSARRAAVSLSDWLQEYNWEGNHCEFVEELLSLEDETLWEVFLAPLAEMKEIWEIRSMSPVSLTADSELSEFLGKVDVLVLDLQGIGSPRGNTTDTFLVEKIKANFLLIGEEFTATRVLSSKDAELYSDGATFFHMHFADLSKNCFVAILTHTDESKEYVQEVLHPFTVTEGSFPYVAKFGKNKESNNSLADCVFSHFEFAKSGLTDATNRRQIAFAACHDLPVIIIGETGTGKERIAKAIHRLWIRKKLRAYPALRKFIIEVIQVVNCAGLNEELARSELFGFIKNSFTNANEQRLGKVFLASGISMLPSSKLKLASARSYQAKFKEQNEQLQNVLVALEQMEEKNEPWEIFNQQIVPWLNDFFDVESRSDPNSGNLLSSLRRAAKLIDQVVHVENSAAEFRELLLENASGVLEESGSSDLRSSYDLTCTLPTAIGTLFLDEFGDLPLLVQTLLLRFFENGEASPIGYPGVIKNLKSRVIVATSDSRVAAFAGQELDDFRTAAELERPLRVDLLHRVKGQVIRVEPITPKNVRSSIVAMIDSRSSSRMKWEPDAIDYLVRQIELIIAPLSAAQIENCEEAVLRRKSGKFATAFGHRRELGTFIDLVWAYANSVNEIGIRDRNVKMSNGEIFIEKEVIERLWSPSMIRQPDTEPVSSGTNLSRSSDTESISKIQKRVCNLLRDVKVDFNETDWSWKEIKDKLAKKLEAGDQKPIDRMLDLMSEIHGDYKNQEVILTTAFAGPKSKGKPVKWATYRSNLTNLMK